MLFKDTSARCCYEVQSLPGARVTGFYTILWRFVEVYFLLLLGFANAIVLIVYDTIVSLACKAVACVCSLSLSGGV